MENVSKTFKFKPSRAEESDNSHEPEKNKLKQNNGNGDAVNTTAYVHVCCSLLLFSRFWGLEWILMIRCLQFCSFLTTKGLYLMLERDYKDFVLSIRLSYQRLIMYVSLVSAPRQQVDFQVNIWGPSDLKLLVEAMKSFIPHAAMVHTKLISDDCHVLVDNNAVKVSAILLRPNLLEGSHIKPCEIFVIYVCKLYEIRGKFNKEKADALGLSIKEKYRILQHGDSVKSDLLDIMVHPSDVFGPSIPGPIVFIVDCPTESHAQVLLPMGSLNGYYSDFSSPQSTKVINCIIHLTPGSVVSSPSYEKWMQKFDSAQHIMAGHEMKNVEIPILKSGARRPVSKLSQSIFAENLLKFNLRPHAHLGLDKSNVPSLIAPSDVIDELLLEIPEIVDAAQHVSEFWKEPRETKEDTTVIQDYKVGEFAARLWGRDLSTTEKKMWEGGADAAVRNLRCVWISHTHADHHAGLVKILTLRQDLLMGTTHEPILVIGPMQLKRFHDEYQRLEDLHMQFLDCRDTVVASWNAFEGDTEDINHRTTNNSGLSSSAEQSFLQRCSKRPKLSLSIDNGVAFPLLKRLKKVLSEAGLDRLISFPVVHCSEAFGVVLKVVERNNSAGKVIPGWKLVYSGDTRPCLELIEAAHGATILIHEATFEDGMVGEAIARNHSTTKEAIEVGDSADAYRIILTHFSQRYPKIPSLDEISIQKTCIAFDLVSINIVDLPMLPNVLPYLKLLFKKEIAAYISDDVIDATP